MLKSLILNIGSKAIVIASQFAALIITNHIIGPEGRGIFLAAVTWSNTFFILSHCSLSTGILNLSHKDPANINSLAKISAVSAFVLGIVSILLGFAMFGLHPQIYNNISVKYLLLTFAVIPFMMLQQYCMAVMQVKGNFKAFNILYACYAVTNLTGITIVWLMHKTSVDLLIYINLFAWIVTGIASLYYCWPIINRSTIKNPMLRTLAKVSIAAHFGAIVSFIISRSDILIVNYFSTDKQTGIYGLAVGIVQILLIIPLSIQNILYHALLGKTLAEQKKILLQYARITFTVMTACAIGILLLSRPLVYIVGGKNFAEAIPLFKYFLPGIVFYSIPMVMATQWNIMGIFRQVNIASIFVLVISILSNILLIPYIGVTGGAITFLVVGMASFLLHIWFAKKNLGLSSIKEIIVLKKQDLSIFISKNKK